MLLFVGVWGDVDFVVVISAIDVVFIFALDLKAMSHGKLRASPALIRSF